MGHVLHLDSSPRGERSHSRKLSKEILDSWLRTHPGDSVVYRDLGRAPVPLVDEPMIGAAFTPPEARTPEQREAIKVSDELVDELLAADTLISGIPMYNFGVPAGFKAYIDQIVRVGRTFSRPDFRGLAVGKKLIVAMSAGQEYAVGTPFADYNFVEPYLRAVFGFIGITDLEFLAVATHDEANAARTFEAALPAIHRATGEHRAA